MSKFYVGAQNDSLYITSGKPPAKDNDYPNHEADRTVIAKVYDEKSANLLAAAPEMLEALKAIRDEDPDCKGRTWELVLSAIAKAETN